MASEIVYPHPEFDPKTPLTISVDMFPEGSLGRRLMPINLLGKTRPQGTFARKVDVGAIGGFEVKTIHDWLNLPLETIEGENHARARGFESTLNKFFRDLDIGPEGRLIGRIWEISEKRLLPLPADKDDERNRVVKYMLNDLPYINYPTGKDVLIARYGIETGVPKTPNEIRKIFKVYTRHVQQVEAETFRQLRSARYQGMVAPYLNFES